MSNTDNKGITPIHQNYFHGLLGLLPRGLAWPKLKGSNLITLVKGIASEYARLHELAEQLPSERNPHSTVLDIDEWEEATGLPDECSSGVNTTIEERRNAVLAKMFSLNDHSVNGIKATANQLGYADVNVTEYHPFRVGISAVGSDRLLANGHSDRFNLGIHVKEPRITRFRVGLSRCGSDPLVKVSRAEDLECTLKKNKLAHMNMIFTYDEGVQA